MAKQETIEFFSGNDVDLKYTIDDADAATPQAKNLTGLQEAIFAIAKAQGKPPLLTKALGTGIVVTDIPNGKLTVSLTKADTEALSGAMYHELRLRDGNGKTSTTTYGVASILKNSITT